MHLMDQLLHLLLLLLTIAWWNCEIPLASGMRQSKSASKAAVFCVAFGVEYSIIYFREVGVGSCQIRDMFVLPIL